MADQPFAYVQIRDPEGKMSRTAIFKERVTIGRSAEADIRLQRESISRLHAELTRDPFGRWVLRDLGSRNGIKVKDDLVKQAVIRYGDKFEIGKFEMKLWNLRPNTVSRQTKPAATAPLPSIPETETVQASVSSLADAEPQKIDTVHLTTLTEFGQRLTEVEDSQERLRTLCRFLVRRDFHGLSAMPLRLDKKHPHNPPQVLCEPQLAMHWEKDTNYVSRSLIRAVRTTRAPVLANNVGASPAGGGIEMSMAPEAVGRLAAVACPLLEDENTLDVLYALLPPEFGTPEWLAVIALAATQYQQAESIWMARQEAQNNAAIEQDLASARKIQERLVPRNVKVDNLDFFVTYQPCEWVGGDYVDAVKMHDGRMFFCIADVSGHGLPAALIALSLHSMVHTYIRTRAELPAMMAGLNEHLCEYLETGTFVTMVGLVLDPRTGEIECINAGHPPASIISPEGSIRSLQVAEHHPLGLQSMAFSPQRERIDPGHVLAMFSDGLTEIADADGKLLNIQGINRHLARIVKSTQAQTSQDVAERLIQFIEELETNLLPQDDRSFLAARWLGH